MDPEKIQAWIELGYEIANRVPGAISGIVNWIHTWAPADVQQVWTLEKVTQYLSDYDRTQQELLDEFEKRRTPIEPEPEGPEGPIEPEE